MTLLACPDGGVEGGGDGHVVHHQRPMSARHGEAQAVPRPVPHLGGRVQHRHVPAPRHAYLRLQATLLPIGRY